MRTATAVLSLLLWASQAWSSAVPIGTFEYRVSWNGIPAADATVAISRGLEEASAYRIEATARTNWLVDLLWSLRARIASTFTPDDLAPLGFRYDRRIRGEASVTDVSFHPPGATGTLQRRGRTQVMEVDDAGALDPVTAIFQALNQPLAVGETRRYDVFTGESRYRVELEVQGEERVSVAGRTYEAFRLVPRLWKVGAGVESRLRRATIWVAKGPPQTVLRLRSEIFIGAVSCDLMAAKPPV